MMGKMFPEMRPGNLHIKWSLSVCRPIIIKHLLCLWQKIHGTHTDQKTKKGADSSQFDGIQNASIPFISDKRGSTVCYLVKKFNM